LAYDCSNKFWCILLNKISNEVYTIETIGIIFGVGGAIFLVWVILAARKECKRMNWKNPKKKLF